MGARPGKGPDPAAKQTLVGLLRRPTMFAGPTRKKNRTPTGSLARGQSDGTQAGSVSGEMLEPSLGAALEC